MLIFETSSEKISILIEFEHHFWNFTFITLCAKFFLFENILKISAFLGINIRMDQCKMGEVHMRSILSSKRVILKSSTFKSSQQEMITRSAKDQKLGTAQYKAWQSSFYSRRLLNIILTSWQRNSVVQSNWSFIFSSYLQEKYFDRYFEIFLARKVRLKRAC